MLTGIRSHGPNPRILWGAFMEYRRPLQILGLGSSSIAMPRVWFFVSPKPLGGR